MKALIIGSGNFSDRVFSHLAGEYFTICADGGYDYAIKNGIKPDIVIGDMDSVKTEITEKTLIFPKEKDETDSEIAMNYAIENGYRELILTGFTGSRIDHTLNNILLLKMAYEKGAKAVIVDEKNEIYYLDKKLTLEGNPGEFLSIIPVRGDVLGVTIENVKYPLKDETLYFGKSRGISNEFLGKECTITAKCGLAIVIKAKD